MRRFVVSLVALCLAAMLTSSAQAWHEVEHTAIAKQALTILPDSVPAFFREGAGQIGHCAIDPDVIKIRKLSQIRTTEYSDHFCDWEKIDKAELPAIRYEFIKLCYEKGHDPMDVGLLPYAVMEWSQRLTAAFAEHRKWPNNPYIKNKCLVYAGLLSHYLGDLHQPLHTTIHWDGRVGDNGKSSRTGIHNKIDGLLRKLDAPAGKITADLKPQAYPKLRTAVWERFAQTFALVDKVYELEGQIPDRDGKIESQAVRDFALERMRSSVEFTASVYLTAWEDSANVKLDSWVDRDRTDSAESSKAEKQESKE